MSNMLEHPVAVNIDRLLRLIDAKYDKDEEVRIGIILHGSGDLLEIKRRKRCKITDDIIVDDVGISSIMWYTNTYRTRFFKKKTVVETAYDFIPWDSIRHVRVSVLTEKGAVFVGTEDEKYQKNESLVESSIDDNFNDEDFFNEGLREKNDLGDNDDE